MKAHELRRALRDLDEDTVVQLGEEFPAVEEAEKRRIYARLQERLRPAEIVPEEAPLPMNAARERFWHLRRAAAAAACLVVCAGTFTGLFWLKAHAPSAPPAQIETGSAQPAQPAPAPLCGMGERCAAENLTGSGTLWLTVEDVSLGEERCAVTVQLTSENAAAPDGSRTFLADNFLLVMEMENGTRSTLQPCAVTVTEQGDTALTEEPAGSYPYALTIENGETRECVLCYETAGKEPIGFATGYSSPYIALN